MNSFTKYRNFVEAILDLPENKGQGFIFREIQFDEIIEHRLSYDDLIQQAEALAALLQTKYQAGDRALAMCPPGIDYVVSVVASLLSGVVLVPVYPPKKHRNNWQRLNSIISDAGPRLFFTTKDEYQQHLSAFKEIEQQGLSPVFVDNKEASSGYHYSHKVFEKDSLAYIQYTSGSTSAPKGLRVTHENILHNMEVTRQSLQLPEEKVFVSWLPFYHDMGLIGTLFQALYFSATYVFMSPFQFVKNPLVWLQAISDYKATISWAPNFAYDLCVDKISTEEIKQLDLSSWCVAANMAEPVRPETLTRFFETFAPAGFAYESLCPAYGMAETTLTITASPSGEPPASLPLTLESYKKGKVKPLSEADAADATIPIMTLAGSGKIASDQLVIIVDPESGQQLADCGIGEIWVWGKSVTKGYFNWGGGDEHAFAGKCQQHPDKHFLKTGDLGFFYQGELYITGRKKDVIIIRGENYYPQDIELTVQRAHASVRKGCIAAFAIEENQQEELIVVAELVKAPLSSQDYRDITHSAKQAVLDEYGLKLRELVLLAPGSYIRTSSGKVQRSLSRQKYLANELQPLTAETEAKPYSSDTGFESAGQLGAWLKNTLAELLKLPLASIERECSFSDYGLDSLSATQYAGLISKKLQRPIPLEIAYDYPNLLLLEKFLLNHSESAPLRSTHGWHQPDTQNLPAIIGMACRFPGAESTDQFWSMLMAAENGLSTEGQQRWSTQSSLPEACTKGGFIRDIKRFDCNFFGITPREAESMDPQQRFLLELCHQALEDAGLSREKVQGSLTGVYVGISDADYARQQLKEAAPESYAGTGSALSIAANRLSYYWDFKGPSCAIDSACSSSLVALNAACQDLLSGEIDMAIVGAVNLLVSPDLSLVYQKANMLSPDGICKVFDDRADGYVRGEGCGVIVLKRQQDAIRNSDPVYALIKASSVMQDGKSNGLSAPVGPAQSQLISRTLAKAGIEPNAIDYVEAHGTGTALGDPIEVSALSSVFANDQKRQSTILLGSVKANIGHLESAAGIAGLIKTALCLKHQCLPPQIHLNKPSNKIPWASNDITILPTHPLAWPEIKRPHRAGVSSFGFGGTLAHAIVEEAPERKRPTTSLPARSHELLCLSAKSKEALLALRDKYIAFLSSGELTKSDSSVGDITYTATTGRSHFAYRLSVQGDSPAVLAQALNEVDTGTEVISDVQSAWLFSGQGAQYAGMGKALYTQEPVFRSTLDHCAELLSKELDYPLLDLLWGEHSHQINETQYTQPALFALGYSLAQLWRSWGHTPSVVMGHSVGEYIAACVAGVFDLASGLRLIAARGRLMQKQTEAGAMAVIFAPADIVEAALLKTSNKQISIAAYNGPENTVVSGAVEGIDELIYLLADYRHHRLSVNRGFHSPLMDSMLDDFRTVAESVDYQKPSLPLISNISGERADHNVCEADYWVEHVRAPVCFEQSIQTLSSIGVDLYLELGPSHTLISMGRQCGVEGRWASSLVSGEPDNRSILNALSILYKAGVEFDWSAYYRDRGHWRVHLPNYAFQGQAYWFERPSSLLPVNERSSSKGIAISPESTIWQLTVAELLAKGLGDHQVYQIPVCPGAFYIAQALDFYSRLYPAGVQDKKLLLEGIVFKQALTLEDKQTTIQFRLDKKAGFTACTVFSIQNDKWIELCQIEKIYYSAILNSHKHSIPTKVFKAEPVNQNTVYKHLDEAGLNLRGQYVNLNTIAIEEPYFQAGASGELSFSIDTPDHWHLLIDNLLQGAVFYALNSHAEKEANQLPPLFVPFAIERCSLDLDLFAADDHSTFYYSGEIKSGNGNAQANFDLTLKNDQGTNFIQLADVTVKSLSNKSLSNKLLANNLLDSTTSLQQTSSLGFKDNFTIQWREANVFSTRDLNASKHGLCLFFSIADSIFIPDLLADLNNAFTEVIHIRPSMQFMHKGGEVGMDSDNPEHWQQLISLAGQYSQEIACIVLAADIPLMDKQNNSDASLSSFAALSPDYLPLFSLVKGLNFFSEQLEKLPLVFLTQASTVCEQKDNIAHPEQATVSALVQTINHEYPWCRAAQIDLPVLPSLLEKQQAVNLLAQLSQSRKTAVSSAFINANFAIRGERVLEPELHAGQFPSAEKPVLSDDQLYLVTGGLGELGVLAAQWLVERGAKKVALLQRSNNITPQKKAIERLEQQGATVIVLACDISNREHLQSKLTQLQVDHGPIRGIIHAAGVLKDSLIVNAHWDEFKQPFLSKVKGTLNLLYCLSQQGLDFCLLYSSITSLMGPPGQANYAMANNFLNALPYVSEYQKLNISSIIWGPWENLGMARDETTLERFRESFGVLPVTVNQAFSILDDALIRQSDPIRIAVEFDRRFSPANASLSNLFNTVFEKSNTLTDDGKDSIDSLNTPEDVAAQLRQMVFKAMKLDAAYPLKNSQTLQELGMDSVMALELQAMLATLVGARLPATLFFDYPTINEVSQFIFDQYINKHKSKDSVDKGSSDKEGSNKEGSNKEGSNKNSVADQAITEASSDKSDLEKMTSDELEQMLASELSDLDALESES